MSGAGIRAVNALTARWARTVAADDGTVFSAAGVWPLLAFLADGAGGHARAELSETLGVPADMAAAAARQLLTEMASVTGLDAALGLWTQQSLRLRDDWRAGLPAGTYGTFGDDLLTAQEHLDAWAAERTGGLVERMPLKLTRDTQVLLASALSLRTTWRQPFTELPLRPEYGPWQGRTLLGLFRRSVRPDRVGVAATPDGHVTALTVPGDNGIDVHLVLGEEDMTPGQVITAGVGLVERTLPATEGGRLPLGHVGPGLHVEQRPSASPEPIALDVRTVAYEVRADHDLLADPPLFGLPTTPHAHFPGIADTPLTIGAARQSAVAQFSAKGFRAGAVTAVAATPGSAAPQLPYTTTVLTLTYDRPFAFLTTTRSPRLLLTSGWVANPVPYPAMHLTPASTS